MTKYIFDGERIDIEHYMKTGRKERLSKTEVFWSVTLYAIFLIVLFLSYWIPLRVLNPMVP
jgi:hypothetical protein